MFTFKWQKDITDSSKRSLRGHVLDEAHDLYRSTAWAGRKNLKYWSVSQRWTHAWCFLCSNNQRIYGTIFKGHSVKSHLIWVKMSQRSFCFNKFHMSDEAAERETETCAGCMYTCGLVWLLVHWTTFCLHTQQTGKLPCITGNMSQNKLTWYSTVNSFPAWCGVTFDSPWCLVSPRSLPPLLAYSPALNPAKALLMSACLAAASSSDKCGALTASALLSYMLN